MVGRGGGSSSASQPDAWWVSPFGYSPAAHLSHEWSEGVPDSRLNAGRPRAEARSISGLCPTRPVLPQGGQSLISGARFSINQVAALQARDRKRAFPGRRAPQGNSPSPTKSHSVDL